MHNSIQAINKCKGCINAGIPAYENKMPVINSIIIIARMYFREFRPIFKTLFCHSK